MVTFLPVCDVAPDFMIAWGLDGRTESRKYEGGAQLRGNPIFFLNSQNGTKYLLTRANQMV
jgi:hypothetical protein